MKPAILVLVLLILACCSGECLTANTSVEFSRGKAAYIIAKPRTDLEKRVVGRLVDYMSMVLHQPALVLPDLKAIPAGDGAIVLVGKGVKSPLPVSIPTGSDEAYALVTGGIGGRNVAVAAGSTDKGLKRAVQRLIIVSRQEDKSLTIPPLNVSEKPWIQRREWTICPWTPELVRGVFYNPDADKRPDIYLYDNDRLAKYVEMYDWFGFSGSQLMETCYTYSVLGSVEAAHQWQRNVAHFLRDNGQDVSLWVWAAEFNGYGWYDPDVKYAAAPGKSQFDDPDVRRGFEKYYDKYAELAPDVDFFIGHFYDPGNLSTQTDVFKYMHLLEAKLKAKNPKIRMGIDGWAAGPKYFENLRNNGFQDYMILPIALPIVYKPGQREALHADGKKYGMKMGIWGWYITEYETDQLASMYVNADLMKRFYLQMRDGALKDGPVEYWSEMEADHLNNIYTMYASSQLLWNPDRDPDEILQEISDGIWGPKNGPIIKKALELVQDTRSGPKWETYWWTDKEHRVGTEDPKSDLSRANESLKALQSMKTDTNFVPKFPLPYPPETFVELMIPHIKQIRDFAEFRIKAQEIRDAAAKTTDRPTLQKMLIEAWKPVPEYGTWVGTFGNQELKEQKKIVALLNKDYGLDVKDPETLRYTEADRLLQNLRRKQSLISTPFQFPIYATNEFAWSQENMDDRMQKLISDGVVVKSAGDKYQLADWQIWSANKAK